MDFGDLVTIKGDAAVTGKIVTRFSVEELQIIAGHLDWVYVIQFDVSERFLERFHYSIAHSLNWEYIFAMEYRVSETVLDHIARCCLPEKLTLRHRNGWSRSDRTVL